MKLTELNESVTELERLDELDLGVFKDIAKKVSKDIQKVYYNSVKGEQIPDAKRAFSKLEKALRNSALDKEWADEIFKDFDHTKIDLTREEVEFYITQVKEADAYIKAEAAKEAAKKAEKRKKESLLVRAEKEFDRLTKLQAKVKKIDSKVAKGRQSKIDTLEKDITDLRSELEG